MRETISVVFLCMTLALGICAFKAYSSQKAIGKTVSVLLWSLVFPVIGNIMIISSEIRSLSTIGCYVYYIGMDITMFSVLRYTFEYCDIKWPSNVLKYSVYILLLIDVIQLLFNPLTGHAFTTEKIIVDGAAYYRLVPYIGQTFHRFIDYGIFFAVLIIFLYKIIRSPKIYSEKYTIIFLSMIVTCICLTYFIFSRTPIDRSIIGFGIFGLLVFYFSLYYRPLRLLDRMLAGLISSIPDAIYFYDLYGKCIWANSTGLELVGSDLKNTDKIGEKLSAMFEGFDNEQEYWTSRQIIGHGENKHYYILEKQDVKDENGEKTGSFLSIRDNTEEQQSFKQELYNATHDSLTGIFTKEYLYEVIRNTLDEHPNDDYLIVFVDVKNFKIVNDIFGVEFGDYALKCIGKWIGTDISSRCVYGRLAGDTFGLCIPKDEFDEQMLEMQLQDFIVINGNMEHHVLIHLGVYEVVDRLTDVSVMFDRAHLALSSIKDEYHKHVAYYDNNMRERVLWEQNISAQLHEALSLRQIVPYLQPISDNTGKIVGCEALVRWIHPQLGFLSPGTFIPVFEKNGMIVEIDKYMWRCACEILSRWKKEGVDYFISVNISPKDFYFMDVSAQIKSLVKKYDVEPSKLRIEITETVMMNDVGNRMQILNELRSAGFIVEMDDFGSGYSSLNMLKDMPVDVLKIDMMFLSKTSDVNRAKTIVQNIINLSNDLKISSLTEGVETKEQYTVLAEMGCKLFQGYYFAMPMTVEEFEDFCIKA